MRIKRRENLNMNGNSRPAIFAGGFWVGDVVIRAFSNIRDSDALNTLT